MIFSALQFINDFVPEKKQFLLISDLQSFIQPSSPETLNFLFCEDVQRSDSFISSLSEILRLDFSNHIILYFRAFNDYESKGLSFNNEVLLLIQNLTEIAFNEQSLPFDNEFFEYLSKFWFDHLSFYPHFFYSFFQYFLKNVSNVFFETYYNFKIYSIPKLFRILKKFLFDSRMFDFVLDQFQINFKNLSSSSSDLLSAISFNLILSYFYVQIPINNFNHEILSLFYQLFLNHFENFPSSSHVLYSFVHFFSFISSYPTSSYFSEFFQHQQFQKIILSYFFSWSKFPSIQSTIIQILKNISQFLNTNEIFKLFHHILFSLDVQHIPSIESYIHVMSFVFQHQLILSQYVNTLPERMKFSFILLYDLQSLILSDLDIQTFAKFIVGYFQEPIEIIIQNVFEEIISPLDAFSVFNQLLLKLQKADQSIFNSFHSPFSVKLFSSFSHLLTTFFSNIISHDITSELNVSLINISFQFFGNLMNTAFISFDVFEFYNSNIHIVLIQSFIQIKDALNSIIFSSLPCTLR